MWWAITPLWATTMLARPKFLTSLERERERERERELHRKFP
jgi:hypothetical protein